MREANLQTNPAGHAVLAADAGLQALFALLLALRLRDDRAAAAMARIVDHQAREIPATA